MPESPIANSSDVLSLKISANGNQISDTIGIASVSITSSVNKIPFAKIELFDGDMPNADFPVSNTADFKPGSEITIDAGYGEKTETIFEGIIVKHGIKIAGDNDTRLIIECRDPAVAMTVGRKNAIYTDKKDSDIIGQLVGNYSGLSANVTATQTQLQELVQYYCSDWDFMLARAEVNGMLVIVDAKKVSLAKPATDGAAVLTVTYGDDLIDMQADMDVRSQLGSVTSSSWDSNTQAIISQQAAPQTLNAQGDLKSAELAKVLGVASYGLQTSAQVEQTALKDWADGQQLKSGLARIRGRMKFQGNASAKPGTLIELKGVGDHFNGNVFVGSVNHQLSQGNWITEVNFGLSPDWFAEQRDLVAPSAAGLSPGVEGLQIGVVMKLDKSPDSQFRIQVSVPILESQDGIWARPAQYYASEGIGTFFIPEIGDEVILGFLNNDPSNAVVLGSLYSAKHKSPYDLTAENYTKAIVTKSELKIEFDDEKKVITILTPGGNTLVLNDDKKSILMQDQNKNKVTLDPDGISLESPKDISIKAQGKIDVNATGAFNVNSNADVTVGGMNVLCQAQTGFTATGNASAELSASGQTTVKRPMVMIN